MIDNNTINTIMVKQEIEYGSMICLAQLALTLQDGVKQNGRRALDDESGNFQQVGVLTLLYRLLKLDKNRVKLRYTWGHHCNVGWLIN